MLDLLTVSFEAHDAGKGLHRRYEVSVGIDLFGEWSVAVRYGRAGQGGQERRYSSHDPQKMRAVIRDHLRRRLSAPRRIGCAYRLSSFGHAPGFDHAGPQPHPPDPILCEKIKSMLL